MTHVEQQAFHEKWIKGVTLKLIVTVLISTISIVASGTYFVQGLKQSIIDGNRENKQFTKDEINGLRIEMNAKFDTVKINQINLQYQNEIKLQGLRTKQGLVTEKHIGNKLVFIPVK